VTKLVFAFSACLAMALPCAAQDFRAADPAVLYFMSIPLDGGARAAGPPAFGIALQVGGDEQRILLHTGMMSFTDTGGIELRWLIFGGVAAAAALAGAAGKSRSEAPKPAAPCPKQPAC
jgi:hypothetical protein